MNLLEAENAIISAVEDEFGGYFALVAKARRLADKFGSLNSDKIEYPCFCLESPEADYEMKIAEDMSSIVVKMTAYLMCKQTEADGLIENIFELLKFINNYRIHGQLYIDNASVAPLDLSETMKGVYSKALNFDLTVYIN